MGVLEGGSGDRRGGAEALRRLVAGLGCTPAEIAALAVLVAGGVAALGLLWYLGRPAPDPDAPARPAGAEDAPAAPELVEDDLVVHVAGEVANPGLYELAAGARVADAVEAAGGPTDEAVTAGLNLARQVSDGEQLYVPGPEETAPAGDAAHPRAGAAAGGHPGRPGGGASAWRPDGRLDLNRATTEDLEELSGIGPVLAERIITYREEVGGFGEVGELRDVAGIGEKTFQAVAEDLVV